MTIPLTRCARFVCLTACLCLALLTATSGRAVAVGPIQVNSTAMTTAAGDGLCTLPEAIRAANTDTASGGVAGECAAGTFGLDVIRVPAGTYTVTAVNTVYAGVPIGLPLVVSPIDIVGDGASTTIIERSSAAGTPDFAIFYVEFTGLPFDRTGSLTLNGVTVRNGRSPGTIRGGGIIAASAVTTIVDSVFSANQSDWGGAIYQPQGRVVVRGSTFAGNTARKNFGAIYAARGILVENSVFRSNIASAGVAGAFGIGPGTVGDVFDSTFIGNESPLGVAGAISAGGRDVDPTRLNVTRSWFHQNRGVDGGAIVAYRLTMTDSVVSDNTASSAGGGVAIQMTGGALGTITNSTFTGNRASSGGGISGDLNLTNVTISGNQATSEGGGIWVNGHFTGNNVTITNNSATKANAFGGGAYFAGWQPVYLANSVIAGNVSGANGRAPDCYIGSRSITSQGHNLVGNTCDCAITAATGDALGTWQAPIDPRLGALQTNGGQTMTHLPLAGGPVIDLASPLVPGTDATACAVADQRGVARPVDGDNDGIARSDRGAAEIDGNPFPTRPAFALAAYSVDEPGGIATISVRRDDPTEAAEITYAAAAGSAGAADFVAAAGTLAFADGESEKTFDVPVLDDTLLEGIESVRLSLRAVGDPADALPYSQAILFIKDDEMMPLASADGASMEEGNTGTRTVVLTVRLTRSYSTTASVAYSTVDGTASAGSDYEPLAGTLVFSPGQTTASVSVRVIGDEIDEDDEQFRVRLRTTVGCTSEIRHATIIIRDDDVSNRAPLVTYPGPQTTAEGESVSFAIAAVDPDGDTVTFSASGLPAGLAIDAATGAITGTSPFGSAGGYDVTVMVDDGRGGSVSVTFSWTVLVGNHRPSCEAAQPSVSLIWPPNHKLMVPVSIGVPDPDGDDVTVVVTAILQDEPTNVTGDGATPTDGEGIGTAIARVRAERSGSPKVPGNGRFYEIQFEATDSRGASCTGFVLVAVPHDRAKPPIDDGVRYDSTVMNGGRAR